MIENQVPEASLTGSTSAHLGTYDFMSPEARSGQAAKRRSDLYAVGVIAYYLLTGQKPLARSKPASTLVKGLSPKWDRLIDKCLELNIEDRYSSATCVLEDLEPLNPEYRPRPHRLRVFILLLAMATLGAMQLYLTYEEDFQRVFRSVRSPTGPVRTIAPGSGTENRMNSIDSATGPDPSSAYIVKLDALRAAAPLDPIDYEWINGTLSNALDDSEANAAHSLSLPGRSVSTNGGR